MFAALVVFSSLFAAVSAHYQLIYPPPRGPFVSDREPLFCGGYENAVDGRSEFPLSNGHVLIKAGHGGPTTVLISIDQNPTNFSVFNTSTSGVELPLAVPFFDFDNSGQLCIPVDIASLNITGVQAGSNITLQVMQVGSKGNLYQCTDLTLAESVTVPTEFECRNTSEANEHGTGGDGRPGADGANGSNGAFQLTASATGILAAVALAMSLL